MPTASSIPRLLLGSLILMMTGPVLAWKLEIGKLRSGEHVVEGIAVLKEVDRVQIQVRTLHLAGLDLRQSGLSVDCSMERQEPSGRNCRGNVRVQEPAWSGRLRAQQTADEHTLAIETGGASIQLSAARAAAGDITIKLRSVPLTWLRPRLQSAWTQLAALAGKLDAQLRYAPTAARVLGELALHDVEFDSTDAEVAGAGLQFNGKLDLRLGSLPELRLDFREPRGQLLFGPIYLELPEATSALAILLRQDQAGSWQLPLISWNDPLGLAFSASLQRDAVEGLDISLSEFHAQLEHSAERYLGSALSSAGFPGLQLAGMAHGHGRFIGGQWKSFELELAQVAISDPQQRIDVDRIDGSLRMDPVSGDNALRWRGARLFHIPLGDGEAKWRWTPEQLVLAQPLQVALLGGTLRIPRLARQRGDDGAEWHAAIELDQLDMLNLATALDWPKFSGSLSGTLPGLVFKQGGFSSDGDLALSVFGGTMRVSELSSERTFGVAPTLGADIQFDNLELKQLSAVLDFGEIDGWLDGRVENLRLLDWAPVAFNAQLRTDAAFPGKKRISQRAVEGLSAVGGGGSAAGNPIMRMFDSFPYAEIGLSCRLAEDVCAMAGLDESAGGYTILRGAGIPRLTVVGHQRKVDWPVLLSRLRAVSAGQAPVIGDDP